MDNDPQGAGLTEAPRDLRDSFSQVQRMSYRFASTGDPDFLDAVIDAWDEILSHPGFATLGESFIPGSLQQAALARTARYENRGERADMEMAVCLLEQAIERAPVDWSERPVCLLYLGMALLDRYAYTGDSDDLKRALSACNTALEATHPDFQQYAKCLYTLASVQYALYRHTGRREHLEEAIAVVYDAAQRVPKHEPDLPMYLSRLGELLRIRYGLTGDTEDLHESLRALNLAYQQMPPGAPEARECLLHLGNVLRDRYALTGQLDNLDQAIALYSAARDALQSAEPSSPYLAPYHNNLGLGLFDRFLRTGQQSDLDQAVRLWQAAVDMTPPASPELANYWNSLGRGFRARYVSTGRLEDLDQALRSWQQAVDLVDGESPDLAIFLNNLGIGWRLRHESTGTSEDLDKAIGFYRQAVNACLAAAPGRPKYLNNLGFALRWRYDRIGNQGDLDEAHFAFDGACQRGLEVAPEEALRSARNWGDWAIERKAWAEAVKAYGYGQQAIDRLFQVQVSRTAKESWLHDAQGLPTNRAYALAQLGRLRDAVEAVEQGRTRLLAEALEQKRRDLERLPELGYGDIYEDYRQTAERIDFLQRQASQLSTDLAGQPTTQRDFSTQRQELETARTELEEVITVIRHLPGYQDFFEVPSFEKIQSVARVDTPLVYLLTMPAGSLALLVQQSAAPSALPLAGFTSATLDDLLYDRNDVTRYLHGSVGGSRAILGAVLDEVLAVLREELMEPLAAHLRGMGYRQAVFIPVDRLSLLPLHAAALDEMALRYLPSAHALRRVLQDREHAPGATRLLGVGNPDSQGQVSLAFARQETEGIATLFASKDWSQMVLYEDEALRAEVTAALPGVTHLHLACHGRFDVENPLDSALYLAGDDTITLRDLLDEHVDLSAVSLAVLSACQTGITDFQNVPDEAVGFPAGFLQAGVPAVVSTLWPVNDLSTALLMGEFYRRHLEEGEGIAEALRRAQCWLRDLGRDEALGLVEPLWDQAQQENPALFQAIDPLYWGLLQGGEEYEHPFAHPYYWGAFTASGAV